ncbi:TVP38/TMEM64 family protein [Vulgatibacter incomptus]|uniref:TVP38/TMEM64 family membrane protein n=1 Tax=Vulgatibacter incomptus TaxID=1391653 RepID=A0A0K1PFL6_9BACT|nr:VTT domain-containing protein [Vulgatibacter incomptus]AKU91909.1 putative integral membrane protein [Vulgatibacter incomptus]
MGGRLKSGLKRISPRSWRGLLMLAGILGMGIAAVSIFGGSEGFTPQAIQRQVIALGALGLAGYLAAAAARPLFVVVSGSLFAVAAGLVWGLWGGVALALCGTLLSAWVVYALARRLGSGAIRDLAGARYDSFSLMARRRGFAFVFVATLGYVFPTDLVIAVAAVTGVRARTVFGAACLGNLPGTILMVSIGSAVVHPSPLLWWVAGAAIALLTVGAAILARSWFPRAERARVAP